MNISSENSITSSEVSLSAIQNIQMRDKSTVNLKNTKEHGIFVLQGSANLFHLLLESVTDNMATPTLEICRMRD